MNVFELLGLFTMGFGIGLSGALIPGPLLGYTITRSVKYGSKTGTLVIIGHALVEIFMIGLIAVGFLRFLISHTVSGIIGLLGAVVLFIAAISLFRQRNLDIEEVKEKKYGPIISGILLTVFNPTFAPWWATVGYNMLGVGFRIEGWAGLFSVILGHWLADFGWYAVISFTVSKGSGIILRQRIYSILKVVISIFMFIIAVYFLVNGLGQFVGTHLPSKS